MAFFGLSQELLEAGRPSRKKLLFSAGPAPDHREGALAVPWYPRRPPGTSGGAYSGGRTDSEREAFKRAGSKIGKG